ncbi:hypothetical protein N5580_13305 [Pantoea piersonii]|uniref:Uncharacterized protein n=1 Tax=Pantoea piersonii TaxID=2364647 RepID=A0AAJ5U906_9GAMM|nr:hypothetical protein [Pantoea piersonii]WBG90064.1 hypothetical protein N5580_13305 [Pantoea piersonii]
MMQFTEERKKALIGRLNQIAEKLKWHNAAYAQDVLLAVDALNATAPQPVKVNLTGIMASFPAVGEGIYLEKAGVERAIRKAGGQVEE